MAILPVPAGTPITQPFGVNPQAYARFGLGGHDGIDFGVPTGTTVVAVDGGTIVEIADDPAGFGHYLRLQTGQGTWIYGHLQRVTVSVGQAVNAGDVIALSDNTGNSTGPHLHLGLRPSGYDARNGFAGYVDPTPSLNGHAAPAAVPLVAAGNPPFAVGDLVAPEHAPVVLLALLAAGVLLLGDL